MANATANALYNNFTKGLVTEASPLNFPNDAASAIENMEINRDGTVRRRLGLDYENSAALIDTGKTSLTFDDHAISAFRWDNVNNQATVSIGVVQVGNNLWFLDLYDASPSTAVLNGGVPLVLNSATVGVNISGNTHISFAPAEGVLLLTSEELNNPYYLSYNSGSDSISITAIALNVRDIWGVNDGLAVSTRPASLSATHQYNLLNQGWTTANLNAVAYPSNADVMQLGKDSNDDFQVAWLNKQFFGNTPAPKGKFIIDAFARGSSRIAQSGVGGLPSDSEGGNVTSVAFYASRVWYAGVNSSVTSGDSESPDYTGYLFFSQQIKNKQSFGKCYQEADPTSEVDSELVATDGGTIPIPEASNILKMITLQRSLIVVAENGIWEVSGGELNFSASDFEVRQLSNIGCASAQSVVVAEDVAFYWAKSGIYVISASEATGKLASSSISITSIQTFYQEDVPSVSKAHSVGVYLPIERKVRWMYSDDPTYDGASLRNKYNKELIFDVTLGAFYINNIHSLSTNSPFPAAYIPTPNFTTVNYSQNVVVNGEQVVVNGEPVVVTTPVLGRGLSSLKFLAFAPTATNYNMTLAEYSNGSFLEWEAADNTGVDCPAFLETGDTTFEDVMRKKQITSIVCHLKRTETGFESQGGGLVAQNPSSCLVRSKWEFSDSANSGKWSSQFQAYRLTRNYIPSGAGDPFDYGHDVISTRTKLRGIGRAIRIRMDSEAGKDMQVLGWGLAIRGSTNV